MGKGKNSKMEKYVYKRILKGNSVLRTNPHLNVRKMLFNNGSDKLTSSKLAEKTVEFYEDVPCEFPCENQR